MDELESLHVCDCGREYCQFFAPDVGEWGQSYSRKQIESIIEKTPKIIKHLKSELNKLDTKPNH